jgi:sulfonate transport system permease protein
MNYKNIFTPFARINKQTFIIMGVIQAIVFLTAWHFSSNGLIPKPLKIVEAFLTQISSKALIDNVITSFALTFKAMAISIAITLVISYLSVIPFFKNLALFIVKCRYLTLTGLIFIFTLLTQDGSQLKLSLLVFGIVPFFVTSFLAVIVSIDNQQFEICKTLGYNTWETLYEVIIVGKADQVLEIIRQNFAITWLMITMVEGLSMSEGGIGTMLIKYNKYNDLTNVLALQLVLFALGLLFDFILGNLKYWLFPYSKLQLQK